MSTKRNLARENEVRRQTTKRKNQDKVIVGYVKTMHPAVYNEAQKYLQGLITESPGKKDPSKIKRFRQMVENKTKNETHLLNNKCVKMDRFQLQIKLGDYGKGANPPAQVLVQNTKVTASSSLAEATAAAGVPTAPSPQDETLSVIDQDTLEDIMADLREDPTIATFFSDFENQLDNCPLW